MLQRDLTGTKILLERVLLPVFGTLDDLVLEHEMTNFSGIQIYGDVYHSRLRIVFEEEHFITHAEKVTEGTFHLRACPGACCRSAGLHLFSLQPG